MSTGGLCRDLSQGYVLLHAGCLGGRDRARSGARGFGDGKKLCHRLVVPGGVRPRLRGHAGAPSPRGGQLASIPLGRGEKGYDASSG